MQACKVAIELEDYNLAERFAKTEMRRSNNPVTHVYARLRLGDVCATQYK